MRMPSLLLTCVALALLPGCKTLDEAFNNLDSAMGVVGDTLDTTGDAMQGDLRTLATATSTTLPQLRDAWKKNEVAAARQYGSVQLAVPGIVTRVGRGDTAATREQFLVFFHDPANKGCAGVAYTRDAQLVQQKRVAALNAGDRITVTGVLDPAGTAASRCNFAFAKAKFAPAR